MSQNKAKPEWQHKAPPLGDGCITFIDQALTKESLVLLTGCRSGVGWLAQRAKLVLAYEHDGFYGTALRSALEREGPRIDGPIKFDLVLVNGIGRTSTVLTMWERVKPGGYLVLGNTQSPKLRGTCWYLDSMDWPRIEWPDGPRRTSLWCRPPTVLTAQTNNLVH